MNKYKTSRELQRHTLFLFEGDFDRLADLYPDHTPSEAIRLLIRKHIESIDKQVQAPLPAVEFDL